VFLSGDLKIQRVMAFPYQPTIALTRDQYLHAHQIRTTELVGQPFHVLSSNGEIVRSFGNQTGKYRADMPLLYDRVVATASDGNLWAAPPGAYIVEKWNPATGTRLSRLEVKSPWFSASERLAPPGERPVPLIDGIWEQAGYLWILFRDADSRWRKPEDVKEREVHWDDFEAKYDSNAGGGLGTLGKGRRFETL